MRENVAAFNRWTILPSYLSGHSSPDTTTTLLGTTLSYPVITAPMGNQGSVHAEREVPTVKGSALAQERVRHDPCASLVPQRSRE